MKRALAESDAVRPSPTRSDQDGANPTLSRPPSCLHQALIRPIQAQSSLIKPSGSFFWFLRNRSRLAVSDQNRPNGLIQPSAKFFKVGSIEGQG